MSKLYPVDAINAPLQEVENLIYDFLEFCTIEKKVWQTDDNVELHVKQKIARVTVASADDVHFLNVRLFVGNGGTIVKLSRNIAGIREFAKDDELFNDQLNQRFQEIIDNLNKQILKTFGIVGDAAKPEEHPDDRLILEWVNRPSIPYENKSDFLADRAPGVSPKAFDRILKKAEARGRIKKDSKGRWKSRP